MLRSLAGVAGLTIRKKETRFSGHA